MKKLKQVKTPKVPKETSFTRWEEYLKKYEKWLKEIRQESFEKFPHKANIVMLPISNSIEFYPREKIEWDQSPHSFLGILRNYLWKSTNWIGYEILNGKYFEAIRDIRFLFEWSILGISIEDAIERKIFEKYGGLSEMGLKLDIVKIWKTIPYYQKKKLKNRKDRFKAILKAIEKYFQILTQKGKLKEMDESKKKEYIKDYASILSDERWWDYPISRLIKEELAKKKFLFANYYQRKKLQKTWKELCEYSHFPGAFLEEIVKDPAFVFVEKTNRGLFKKCIELYLNTLDLCYAAILWRWPIKKTRDRIENLVNLWKRELNINFPLTKKMLRKC
jgi:hypothetical protein